MHSFLLRLHWPRFWRRQAAERSQTIGSLALVGTILAGSTYNAFAKPLSDVLSPFTLLLLSESLVGICVLVSFGVLPTIRDITAIPRTLYLPILATGFFSSVLGPLLWFMGLHASTAIHASLFSRIDIFFSLLLAHFFLHEHITVKHIQAGCIVVAGLIITSLGGLTGTVSYAWSDGLIVLATMSFVMGSVLFRKYLTHVPPQAVLLCRSMVAATSYLVVALFLGKSITEPVISFPMELIPILLAYAFFSRFLSIALYYKAVDHLPISTVCIVMSLETVGSMLFASWFLRETIDIYSIMGCVLIVGGNLLLEYGAAYRVKKERKTDALQHLSPTP